MNNLQNDCGRSIAWLFTAILYVLPIWALAAQDDEEFHIENREIKIHVNADGSSVTDWYEVTRLLTETGIDWYGEESVTFSTSRETLEIVEAYTEHLDGQQYSLDDKAIRLGRRQLG